MRHKAKERGMKVIANATGCSVDTWAWSTVTDFLAPSALCCIVLLVRTIAIGRLGVATPLQTPLRVWVDPGRAMATRLGSVSPRPATDPTIITRTAKTSEGSSTTLVRCQLSRLWRHWNNATLCRCYTYSSDPHHCADKIMNYQSTLSNSTSTFWLSERDSYLANSFSIKASYQTIGHCTWKWISRNDFPMQQQEKRPENQNIHKIVLP